MLKPFIKGFDLKPYNSPNPSGMKSIQKEVFCIILYKTVFVSLSGDIVARNVQDMQYMV